MCRIVLILFLTLAPDLSFGITKAEAEKTLAAILNRQLVTVGDSLPSGFSYFRDNQDAIAKERHGDGGVNFFVDVPAVMSVDTIRISLKIPERQERVYDLGVVKVQYQVLAHLDRNTEKDLGLEVFSELQLEYSYVLLIQDLDTHKIEWFTNYTITKAPGKGVGFMSLEYAIKREFMGKNTEYSKMLADAYQGWQTQRAVK